MDGKGMDQMNRQESTPSISNGAFSTAMLEAEAYNKWVLTYYNSYIQDNLLEIGIGHGAFYNYLPDIVENYVGVDIDEALVNHARCLYPKNKYVQADLASNTFLNAFQDKKINAILCFNVLEHIEDHEMALKNMIDILSPTGHILLFVPAFQFLYTELDRLAGHYRRYTISNLNSLTKKCGGEIVKWSYFNFIGGIGWWVNKFMIHQSLNDHSVTKQIRFFNKIILPISKIIQPLTKKIFGQSLYVVIRKKAS
jgi:SAM-dependent methyltransferase